MSTSRSQPDNLSENAFVARASARRSGGESPVTDVEPSVRHDAGTPSESGLVARALAWLSGDKSLTLDVEPPLRGDTGPHVPAGMPDRILQRLDWTVIRRLDGVLQGDYRSLFYGQGVDLADLREYQPGDDVRYIDWNVTARMNAPYVHQYVQDREITAWFLLDLTPSMDFGSTPNLKRTVLIDFVATLARLLTRHGGRAGAIFFGSRVERIIPPGGGRIQVLRLVNDLLRQPMIPRAPMTDLMPLLKGAGHAMKKRSLVFIVSDFISVPGWERPLKWLTSRHEVIAIRLWDPREVEMPDVGPVIVEDAETGEQLYVDTHDPRFRRRFREAARQREAALHDTFKRAGVDTLSISTDEDMVRAIVRFATLRRRRRK